MSDPTSEDSSLFLNLRELADIFSRDDDVPRDVFSSASNDPEHLRNPPRRNSAPPPLESNPPAPSAPPSSLRRGTDPETELKTLQTTFGSLVRKLDSHFRLIRQKQTSLSVLESMLNKTKGDIAQRMKKLALAESTSKRKCRAYLEQKMNEVRSFASREKDKLERDYEEKQRDLDRRMSDIRELKSDVERRERKLDEDRGRFEAEVRKKDRELAEERKRLVGLRSDLRLREEELDSVRVQQELSDGVLVHRERELQELRKELNVGLAALEKQRVAVMETARISHHHHHQRRRGGDDRDGLGDDGGEQSLDANADADLDNDDGVGTFGGLEDSFMKTFQQPIESWGLNLNIKDL